MTLVDCSNSECIVCILALDSMLVAAAIILIRTDLRLKNRAPDSSSWVGTSGMQDYGETSIFSLLHLDKH